MERLLTGYAGSGHDGQLTVAAVNSPATTVVSGGTDALDALLADCESRGIRARRIPVDYASHCAQVENIRTEVEKAAADVVPRPARIPFFSTVTGGDLAHTELDGAYWYRNLRSTVRFEDTVRALLDAGFRRFVEASAHPVLTTGIQITAEDHGTDVSVTGTLRRDDGGRPRLLRSLAEAFVTGVPVQWARSYDGRATRRVELPTYAFQHRRFWAADGGAARHATHAHQDGAEATGHALLGSAVPLPGTGGVLLTGRLSPREQPWLRDHAVRGRVLVPGTALLDMVLRAGDAVGCDRVEELTLEIPLLLDASRPTHVQVLVAGAAADGSRAVDVHARLQDSAPREAEWVRHARATLVNGTGRREPVVPEKHQQLLTSENWPPADAQPVDITGLHERLHEQGLTYGAAFRGLTRVWRGPAGELFAEADLPGADVAGFGIHPALLDAALHAWPACAEDEHIGRLPFLWTGATLHATGAQRLRATLAPTAEGAFSVRVTDSAGLPVLSADGLLTRPLDEVRLPVPPEDGVAAHRVAWSRVPAAAQDGGQSPVAVLGETAPGFPAPDPAFAGCADLGALAERLAGGGTVPPGHVLVDLRTGVCQDPGGDMAADAERTALHALDLVQQWLSGEHFAQSRLVLVTGGAVHVHDGERMDHLAAAPVWGLVRSAQTEHPGRFVLLDVLDHTPAAPETVSRALSSGEPQLAVRGDEILAPRLVRGDAPTTAPVRERPETVPAHDEDPPGARQLTHAGDGTLEGIVWGPAPEDRGDRALDEHEVRVDVRAVGLNFRDVLIPLGMYPDAESARMGSEGAGVVTGIGSRVTGVAVGDRVMGVWQDAFRSSVVVDERVVVGVPEGWSFVEAASVPVAFVTAFFALVDVAGVRSGESVLVHAAAGGVGMAAVQLARWLGAEVWATASESKWSVVRGLGVAGDRIASSRSVGFAEVFGRGVGSGVDVVVDSLAGELVDASLGLVRPGGRFVELGKADVRDPGEVAAVYEGVMYRAFDLAEVAPERLGEMLREVVGLFETGVLELLPRQEWDVRRAGEAFGLMSRAGHVGKLVLSVPPAPAAPAASAASGTAPGAVSSVGGGGWVLVSGGSGVLGGVVARYLVGVRGVRRLVLLSRGGGDVGGLVGELSGWGAEVRVVVCDVADRVALEGVVGGLPGGVSGVVHAAGVLDDVVVEGLSGERLRGVLAAKVVGGWNLHEVMSGSEGLFVLFSSAAGVLGAAGQANYAAGNAFLDGLAAFRRARGLSGVSVAWGLWEERSVMTGGLERSDLARMRRMGVLPMSTEDGLRLLDTAEQSADSLVVAARFDPRALVAGGAHGAVQPMLRDHPPTSVPVRRPTVASAGDGRQPDGPSLPARFEGLGDDERQQLVLRIVREHTATVLGYDSVTAIPAERGFLDLGIDSLTAVELRNRLKTETGLPLPATLVFDHPDATRLARHLAEALAANDAAGAPGDADPTRVTPGASTPAAVPGTGASDVSGHLQSANADELFDFIDRELGSD
ncbi:KR domain-containing protein [Streptomyces sp. AA1529]